MPETKTFRNATISDGGEGITLYPRGVAHTMNNNLGTFLNGEWDVEITFTRKPRPIAVGDNVHMRRNGVGNGTVLALFDGDWPEAKWAWLQWSPFVSPTTALVSDLKRVEN